MSEGVSAPMLALPSPAPSQGPPPGAPPAAAASPAPRHDGWLPDRRRTFLAAVSEGHTVEAACRLVGLSPAAAYALRRRDTGFALGWAAACLLAREALADTLMSRAIDGQVETWTRADGSEVTRHRHDNRLGQAMLARLDRLAEAPAEGAPQAAGAAAARAAAGAFDGFLALVGEGAAAEALDGFAGEQAGGGRTSQLSQLRAGEDGGEAAGEAAIEVGEEPVWFDDGEQQWRTSWPPPKRFRGEEWGDYGDEDYWRALTPAERAVAEQRRAGQIAATRDEAERSLQLWLRQTLGERPG